MRIAVAGGTGVVGRLVVDDGRRRGHEMRVLARSTGIDLTTGAGLDAALTGVDTVVDVSGVFTTDRDRSVAFFGAATGGLLAAGVRAGVTHHVALSIVGVDRVDAGYYAGKCEQERLVLAGPVPATVLRTTQFHEFPGQLIAGIGGPVVPVPRMRTAPVAAAEVAAALLDLAAGGPAGIATPIAGPREYRLADLVRRVLRAGGSRRLVLTARAPGPVGRAMADGSLLPAAGGRIGRLSFEDWLQQH